MRISTKKSWSDKLNPEREIKLTVDRRGKVRTIGAISKGKRWLLPSRSPR